MVMADLTGGAALMAARGVARLTAAAGTNGGRDGMARAEQEPEPDNPGHLCDHLASRNVLGRNRASQPIDALLAPYHILLTLRRCRAPSIQIVGYSEGLSYRLRARRLTLMHDDPGYPSADHPVDLAEQLPSLANPQLLETLDTVLLELERRLLRYAQVGHQLQQMADEGLVLSARAAARLGQAQSSAIHTQGHLQVVGVGGWRPTSTQPGWGDDPRLQRPDEPAG
jgi:hypothetical protein